MVKEKLKGWNHTVFGQIQREIAKKKEELQQIQASINFLQDVQKEMEVSTQLETLPDREEIMWAQKARSTWIIKGDQNTKYFQTIARNRRL